jgi:hypothetical protein
MADNVRPLVFSLIDPPLVVILLVDFVEVFKDLLVDFVLVELTGDDVVRVE